ncbi:C40 family peptidase [Lacticaseibacillus zeae]|nr:C40 family peptidase [Lacticaseibacillus zeae]
MRLRQLVTGAITVATLAGVGVSGVAATTVRAADDKSSLQAKNDDLMKQLQAANDKSAKLSNDVSNKVLAIQKAEAEIKDTQAKITDLDGQLTKANQEASQRKNNLKDQLISLQKRVGNSVTGNVYFDFILNSSSLTDLVGRSFTVSKLSQASTEALQAVKDSEAKVKDLKANQEAKQKSLVATKAQLESDKAKIDSLKADADEAAAEAQKLIDANKDKLAELAAEEAAKTAAAQKAVSDAASTTSTSTASSTSTVSASNNASSTSVTSSTAPASAGSSKVSVSGGGIASNAAKYIGVPYVYGGTSPSGFDCSGLIYYAAKEAGVNLPRTSQAQSTLGSYVAVSDLQAGDLVFWGGVGSAYHVGIYIGNGQYIHAPAPGQNVTVQSMAYFAPEFGRRL